MCLNYNLNIHFMNRLQEATATTTTPATARYAANGGLGDYRRTGMCCRAMIQLLLRLVRIVYLCVKCIVLYN